MKSAIITLAAVTGFASLAAGQYFGIVAAHSGSAIHLQPLEANGERIWIGSITASYCPIQPQSVCPKGVNTNFIGGDETLSMGAEVPGGQMVYIDPTCGAVMYTQAHSAMIPNGAILNGWTLDEESAYGSLAWENGLVACSSKGNSTVGPYEVYAQLPGIEFGEECIGFDALTYNETAPASWQYT